ncbi:MAG: GEVED domain-containing protein, partial [bacterium]|nr:GEVED domain-containing protein [bacterium]
MQFLFGSSDKQRVRQQQKLARQRKTRQRVRGQLESLEARKLLAVDLNPAMFGQMFTNETPGDGVTQVVERSIPLSHGADAAIAISASYTDTNALFPEVDVEIDGTTHTIVIPPALGPFTDGGANPFGGVVEGFYQFQSAVPPTSPINGATTLNSFTMIIPVGSAAMDRIASVKLRGGVSTDFIATTGAVYGVEQSDPMGDFGGNSGGSIANSSTLTLLGDNGQLDPGNVALDAILGIQRQTGTVQLLTNLNADPLAIDPEGNHVEFFESAVTTSTALGALIRGASSTDRSADGTDNVLDWELIQSAAAYSHAAMEIQMAQEPTQVLYDGADAPGSYGTTGVLHAPKGPLLGTARDAETLTTIGLFPGAAANGDDINNIDDEDGVTNLRTMGMTVVNPAPPGDSLGTFVTQSMANNQGSIDVQVTGVAGGQIAYVTVYVDWLRDGNFNQPGDLVVAAEPFNANGTKTLTFNIPTHSGISVGDSFMRVRVHTASMGEPAVLPPSGHANDGEAEDYKITLIRGAEIHGFKFEDFDGDGVLEEDDKAMGGVVMTMPGATDVFGKPVASTITNQDGEFWFVNLPAGSYTVAEDLFTTDTNLDGYFDHNPGMKVGQGYSVGSVPVDQGLRASPGNATDGFDTTLTAGQVLEGVEFGNYVTGSIHGYKFEDLNADGKQDPGEDPIEGIPFDLWKFLGTSTQKFTSNRTETTYSWTKVGSESTDVHGEFWFTHLDPGLYEVREQDGAWIQTTGQPQTDLNAKVSPTQFGQNPADSTTIFEIVSRREFVWEAGASTRPKDFDDNGELTADEIQAGIVEGALKVEVLATPDVDPAPADQDQDLWFGNLLLGTITGFKVEDVNQDGVFAGGDVPLGNVTMELSGVDQFGSPVSQTTLTATDGTFTFSNLVPGDYTVVESATTDTNNDGTADVDQDMLLDPREAKITLASGGSEDAGIWGNYVYGSIHGVKFHDLDADGNKETGEPVLEGVDFQLYKFLGTNTQKLASGGTSKTYDWTLVGTATSDIHGEFWFTQLDAGYYELIEPPQGDWMLSTSGQLTTAPTSTTAPRSGFEIISRREYVWEDGAASREIDGKNFVGDTDMSDADGFIDDDEVAAGYNAGALKNESQTNALIFGNFKKGVITGFKYEDVNLDGKYTAGTDVPLGNVLMELSGKKTAT